MPPYKLAIFDFDDTIGHLTVRWSEVRRELLAWAEGNGTPVEPESHLVVVANGLSETPEGKREVVEVFGRYEGECLKNGNWLMFPSMVSLMKDLRKAGYHLAIATGNNVGTVNAILKKEKLADIVDMVVGMDAVRISKPDPETLDRIVQKLGIEKRDSIFIGNSEYDALAGKNAGIETIKIRTLWEDDVTMLREKLLG